MTYIALNSFINETPRLNGMDSSPLNERPAKEAYRAPVAQ